MHTTCRTTFTYSRKKGIPHMPYKVEQDGDEWIVVNTETNEEKARHETKEDAERQVRLLHELEKDEKDE